MKNDKMVPDTVMATVMKTDIAGSERDERNTECFTGRHGEVERHQREDE